MKDYRSKLPKVERDLSFLQYLKSNQPPYLDALFALANAAPSGTRFETLSMNGHGDLSGVADPGGDLVHGICGHTDTISTPSALAARQRGGQRRSLMTGCHPPMLPDVRSRGLHLGEPRRRKAR